jgi:YbbR domain-containing protein
MLTDFLLRLLARVPAMLGSTFFAVLIWTFVAMSKRYVATKNIPVVVRSETSLQTVSSGLPERLEVKFEGDGWKILSLFLAKTEWVIDPSNELSKNILTIDAAKNPTQYIKPLPADVDVLDVQPAQFSVTLDRKLTKTVPLYLLGDLLPALGYTILDYKLSPDTVQISGAETLISRIEQWSVVPSVDNLEGTFVARLPLSDTLKGYVTTNVSLVTLTGRAEKLTQTEFQDVPIRLLGEPREGSVTLIPNKMNLTVGGALSDLVNLHAENVQVTVDYHDIVADTIGSVQVAVQLPPRIKVLRQSPERLQYILRR